MSDLAATQPIENANMAMETEAEVQPKALFKKKRAPTTTKGAKQTGGSAKSAAAGKKQRKSVKEAAAKPVAKKPKVPKSAKKPKQPKAATATAATVPKTPRKKKSAPGTAGLAANTPDIAANTAAPEGSKFDAIVEMLVQMANDRIAAGQDAAGASSSAPAADSTSVGGSNPTAPEVGAGLPNLVGRVTGV